MSDPKPCSLHREQADTIEPTNTRTMEEPISRVDTHASVAPRKPWRNVGNPAPLGLGGFALTTFVLSLINMQTQRVLVPNLVLGPALAYGGVTQFCAGMWCVTTIADS